MSSTTPLPPRPQPKRRPKSQGLSQIDDHFTFLYIFSLNLLDRFKVHSPTSPPHTISLLRFLTGALACNYTLSQLLASGAPEVLFHEKNPHFYFTSVWTAFMLPTAHSETFQEAATTDEVFRYVCYGKALAAALFSVGFQPIWTAASFLAGYSFVVMHERSLYSDVDAFFLSIIVAFGFMVTSDSVLTMEGAIAMDSSNRRKLSSSVSSSSKWRKTLMWEQGLARMLVFFPCLCQFCWAVMSSEDVFSDKEALVCGLVCLLSLPANSNLLATVRLLFFGYLSYAAYGSSSMAGFKRTPPIVSYYALQAVASLLFFSERFQSDMAVSIDDMAEDLKDMLPSQSRQATSSSSSSSSKAKSSQTTESDSKKKNFSPSIFVAILFGTFFALSFAGKVAASWQSRCTSSTTNPFGSYMQLPPLSDPAALSLDTRQRYCEGDMLLRVIQTNYFEGRSLDLYASPLTKQQVNMMSNDATLVLQLAQMSTKSTKGAKEGGVQADYYRSYDNASGGRKIFYRSSKLIGDLQSTDNFKGDYYDLDGGGWMSPPPSESEIERVQNAASNSATSSDRSTCFAIPSGSTVQSLLLPPRRYEHSPTAMEYAIHDMCDNGAEVTIVPVVGKVRVEFKDRVDKGEKGCSNERSVFYTLLFD
ncbi:hypothetical protein TrLO_g15511 [Triparma laevis f. longispina]|uniref:Uncharacterized protein n=1 Tax=Triparma laevis f. longispina TaxID=1714387 RepID=A0A9W7B1C3_9STRA|nr:hypothetical protein TrLO_g15511 [Triparma laevis f. longispina]